MKLVYEVEYTEPEPCPACGKVHLALPPYDCPLNPYGWPYSNKCPECGERAMENTKCTACGEDQHMEQCSVCGVWQNWRYLKDGTDGCCAAWNRHPRKIILPPLDNNNYLGEYGE